LFKTSELKLSITFDAHLKNQQNMRHLLFLSLCTLMVWSCQPQSNNNQAIPSDLADYEITDIPGSPAKKAVKEYVDGSILEEGRILNGLRTGLWVTYSAGNTFPDKIMTYANGMANGPYFEFNERGQIEIQAYYKDNKLHGKWGEYKFSRPIKEAFYTDGQLDGVYREYKTGSGKVQKEIEYKNGKMDGRYLFYDDEGNIILDYQYKNGEKVD
jgi:antitoxin component YwqK of YwqJK toxin-antitoxin module